MEYLSGSFQLKFSSFSFRLISAKKILRTDLRRAIHRWWSGTPSSHWWGRDGGHPALVCWCCGRDGGHSALVCGWCERDGGNPALICWCCGRDGGHSALVSCCTAEEKETEGIPPKIVLQLVISTQEEAPVIAGRAVRTKARPAITSWRPKWIMEQSNWSLVFFCFLCCATISICCLIFSIAPTFTLFLLLFKRRGRRVVSAQLHLYWVLYRDAREKGMESWLLLFARLLGALVA